MVGTFSLVCYSLLTLIVLTNFVTYNKIHYWSVFAMSINNFIDFSHITKIIFVHYFKIVYKATLMTNGFS